MEWWRAHREAQHDGGSGSSEELDALRDLYAYCYSVDPEEVRSPLPCGPRRWTCPTGGCRTVATRRIPGCAEERALLVRSYAALLAAVHR